jgi:hypothetical protein
MSNENKGLSVYLQNNDGPIARALRQVLGLVLDVKDVEVVIVDSVEKVLYYLQQTELKVVQYAHDVHHPMEHLIEDYPDRLRVIKMEETPQLLLALVKAISELKKGD